ncbi:MAG: hypothetical protein B6U76_06455 [Desulfurococcales archaeon ex4484_217_2]|nr:MAG: hypothetical protein B6U76_06455 [Desulfurococcales archaeon ex4484_217_2]
MTIEIILTIVLIVSLIVAAETRDLLVAIVALGIVGLIVAIYFYLLQAPDVAMTQAVVGISLAAAFYILGVRRTKRFEEE